MTAEYDLWVDFNAIRRGMVVTLREFATNPGKVFHPSEWVVVGDHDGNTCTGLVHEIQGDSVTVHLIMQTFSPGETR